MSHYTSKVSGPEIKKCNLCNGRGMREVYKQDVCLGCRGEGTLRVPGHPRHQCHHCKATGKSAPRLTLVPCEKCGGRGII